MLETKYDSCEAKGSCETAPHGHCGKCPCGCGCDHECPMYMWTTSLHCAKKSLMVDILKSKIQKSCGAKMEQTADLILEAMKNKGKAECELKTKLHELWEKEK